MRVRHFDARLIYYSRITNYCFVDSADSFTVMWQVLAGDVTVDYSSVTLFTFIGEELLIYSLNMT